MEGSEIPPRDFPQTDWSLVQRAGQSDDDAWVGALGELLRRYELPLRRYLLDKCRCDEHKARDLFQGFVVDIVLKKELIGQARPSRGHQFRSFILRALSNYVVSEYRKEQSRKRQTSTGAQSLDALLEHDEIGVDQSWSHAFDVTWARSVVAEAMRRMETDCLAAGQTAIWGVFEERLRRPILEGIEPAAYKDLVEQFGFASPVQAQNALTTAKRKFISCLRGIISEYIDDETSIAVELRELQLILANANANRGNSEFKASNKTE